MIKNDMVEKERLESVFVTPNFSCPICRQKTLISWYLRPINRLALEELRKDALYEEAYNKYMDTRNVPILDIPEKINLASIAIKSRQEKAETLYKEILPILFDAATSGKSFITITSTRVKEIQLVADLLAKKLFTNNKIYKLVSTPRECDIEIVPSTRTYKSEYVNPILSGPPLRLLPLLPLTTRPIR